MKKGPSRYIYSAIHRRLRGSSFISWPCTLRRRRRQCIQQQQQPSPLCLCECAAHIIKNKLAVGCDARALAVSLPVVAVTSAAATDRTFGSCFFCCRMGDEGAMAAGLGWVSRWVAAAASAAAATLAAPRHVSLRRIV